MKRARLLLLLRRGSLVCVTGGCQRWIYCVFLRKWRGEVGLGGS